MSLLLALALAVAQTPPGGAAPVVVYAAGDYAIVGSAENELRGRYADALVNIKPLLADRDAAIVNLEAPLTTRGQPYVEKTWVFRARPETLAPAVDAGFNVFGLSNNHFMDYGPIGLEDSLAALQAAGVAYAGAGKNLAAARRPAVIPLPAKNSSVAVLSYSMTFPEEFYAGTKKPGTSPGVPEYIERDVREAAKNSPVVVVVCHWSAELLTTPKDYQIETAHRAIAAGADLVVGHHPHVTQGVEFYQEGVIFYSVGNFVFGSYSQRCRTALLARAEFSPEGKLLRAEAVPLWVYNPEVNFQPRVLAGDAARSAAAELADQSKALGTRVEFDDPSDRLVFRPSP